MQMRVALSSRHTTYLFVSLSILDVSCLPVSVPGNKKKYINEKPRYRRKAADKFRLIFHFFTSVVITAMLCMIMEVSQSDMDFVDNASCELNSTQDAPDVSMPHRNCLHAALTCEKSLGKTRETSLAELFPGFFPEM